MKSKSSQRDKEEFNVGAVAVTHTDDKANQVNNEAKQPATKLGAFVLAKTDEKLLEPGEQLVTVVRRHPIGIIGIYAEMGSGILAIIVIVLLVIYSFFPGLSGSTKGLIAAIALFIVAFMVGVLFISLYVYHQCRLIVTDKSVVQVLQRALFNRKISRLSMSNVEDVNVTQRGILQTWLNYGTLTIQTAGHLDNFVFTYCPDPDSYANRVLEARQQFVRQFGERPEPEKTTSSAAWIFDKVTTGLQMGA